MVLGNVYGERDLWRVQTTLNRWNSVLPGLLIRAGELGVKDYITLAHFTNLVVKQGAFDDVLVDKTVYFFSNIYKKYFSAMAYEKRYRDFVYKIFQHIINNEKSYSPETLKIAKEIVDLIEPLAILDSQNQKLSKSL